ncbi:MAG: NAD(+)/NADH kinase [Candidatus Tectomicrobia bacterium]|uniref:NAD kinase n=1 Tax=Tectimicrobiota bacterium TaxID=2528274 RepID=A0A932GPP7_UNCTE|nr:NAD(+)/NADH kinase [Candidatus Tectomicrobia bacterium]
MEVIGVIAKPSRENTRNVLETLLPWLRQRTRTILMDKDTAATVQEASPLSRSEVAQEAQLMLVLGGDGTFLSVARVIGERGTPILGVNLGSLGFLTEITLEDLYPTLEKVLAGDYRVEERLMLSAVLSGRDLDATHRLALNDVVINKGALARIIHLETHINQQFVTTFRADGLIVATPTGSTAYSLAAGGPIVYPTMDALVLSPICPHTVTNRPLVLPGDCVVEITLKTPSENVMVTLDGQVGFPIQHEDTLKVQRAQSRIRVVQPYRKNYFGILRTKLKWGEGPP